MRSPFSTLSTDRCEYPDRIKVALMCSTKSRRRLILISRTSYSSVFWMVIVERLCGSECIFAERKRKVKRPSVVSVVSKRSLLQRLTIKWNCTAVWRCRSTRAGSFDERATGACTCLDPHSVATTRWVVRLGAGQNAQAVISLVTERRTVGASGTPAFAPKPRSSLRVRRGWAVG